MGKRILGIIILVLFVVVPGPSANRLLVLDVGQGDAIVLTTKQGQSVLVDGGPDDGWLTDLHRFVPGDVLDLLVISHYDADHIAGLLAVFDQYSVTHIWLPEVLPHTHGAWEVRQAALAEGAQVVNPKLGDRLILGQLSLEVLSPDPLAPVSSDTPSNDQAYVIGVSLGETHMLLTSDAPEARISQAWSFWNKESDLEVLKVGHHGSNTSTSLELITQLQPELAIISVGQKNRYHHPAQSTLDALQQAGVPIWRTDQQGTANVVLNSDGTLSQDTFVPGIVGWVMYWLEQTKP